MLTSAPSSSTRYLIDGIQPSGAWRCALPAKPSPYSTPAAAWIGNAPGPPGGIGGASYFAWFDAAVGAIGPPAPAGGAFGAPRRIGTGGAIVGMFGSAPYFTSRRIASTSVAYAARQNAVEPDVSARPQLRLPQPL